MDTKVFENDFESERDSLIHSLSKAFGSGEDAIVIDAADRALEKWNEQLGLGTARPFHPAREWLFKTASNLMIDALRHKKLEPRLKEGMDAANATEASEEIEIHEDLLKLLQLLPKESRDIFKFREMEHRSLKEVAKITGLKPSTISQRCRRAWVKLKRIAADDLAAAERAVEADRLAATGDRLPAKK